MYHNDSDDSADAYDPGGVASAIAAKHRLAIYFQLWKRRQQEESDTQIFLRATFEEVQLWRL